MPSTVDTLPLKKRADTAAREHPAGQQQGQAGRPDCRGDQGQAEQQQAHPEDQLAAQRGPAQR
jgi:hypothetical protein